MIIYPKNYVVWDLETSGLDPQSCKILEVGAMVVQDGQVVREFGALINHGIDLDPKITEITGLTKEKLAAEGQDPKVVLSELIKILAVAGKNITHNGSRFDIPFLQAQTRGLGIFENDEQHMAFFRELREKAIDTAAIFKGEKLGMKQGPDETFFRYALRVMDVRAPGLKYNVGVCCDSLGIDRSSVVQHRAGGDVALTDLIFRKLTTPALL